MKESTFQKTMWLGLLFLIILGVILTYKTCHGQNKLDTTNLIELNPYENDASGEDFDAYEGILFVPSNILDFVYHPQDNEYVIEYDDPDCFDTDNMLYHNDGDYYYIEIYCDSSLFFEYLSYYNSLNGRKDHRFIEPSNSYFIKEEYLSDGTPYYNLVKYVAKEDLQ